MVKNTPFLIRNLSNDKKEEAKNDFNMIETMYNLREKLDFYKSIFKSHINSAIFNLRIKKINGENVWYDTVMDRTKILYLLDEDDEVKEWKIQREGMDNLMTNFLWSHSTTENGFLIFDQIFLF